MKKIVIIGSPGAGKSTFAQALGRILSIKVFHLDRYFWQPGWKEYPQKERIEIEQQYILTESQWIIEGSYLNSSDNRLHAADTIIFLDMPRFLCAWQAIKRYIRYHGRTRSDLPPGCTERFNLRYIWKILAFPQNDRRLLLTKIEEIQAHKANALGKKTIVVLKSHKEAGEFLQGLTDKRQRELCS